MPKTQKTPKGETIPVPKRADVLRDMLKIARRKPPRKARKSSRSAKK
jgi:hypothetical protein